MKAAERVAAWISAAPRASRRADAGATSAPLVTRHRAITVAVATVVVLVAMNGGGYATSLRTSLAIAAAWALVAAALAGVLDVRRLMLPAVVTGMLLALFASYTALSIAWAASAERAFAEFNRTTLYAVVFVCVALFARRRDLAAWSDGLAVGIVAVAGVALASRFLPTLIHGDEPIAFAAGTQTRLYYPVGYWTGLGVLIALGIPLLLRAAVGAAGAATRAVSVGALPALALALYLTSARLALIIAVVAVGAFVALAPTWRSVGALGTGVIGSAVAIAVTTRFPELVDPPTGADAPEASHWGQAAASSLVFVATGAAFALGARALRTPPPLSLDARRALAMLLVILATAGLGALDPARRFAQFKEASPGVQETAVADHLTTASSNGRWQLWTAAVDQARESPVVGMGAGSFEAWWRQHGSLAFPVRDAHSLYLETAGELGVLGLLLIVAAVGSGVVVGFLRVRRLEGERRVAAAAVLSSYAAFLLAVGADWMWELTIVALVGVVCLALLTGASSAPGTADARGGYDSGWVRASVAAGALAVIATQGVALLSDVWIHRSEDALAHGRVEAAESAARRAVRVQPWAASPHLQLALVHEQRGHVHAAHESIVRAVARDRADWSLWLVRARLARELGDVRDARRSRAEARRLNPHGG